MLFRSLKFVAGALGGMSSKNSSANGAGSSGSPSSNFYGPSYQPTATTVFIDGRVRGNDLVIATYNQNLRNGRVK